MPGLKNLMKFWEIAPYHTVIYACIKLKISGYLHKYPKYVCIERKLCECTNLQLRMQGPLAGQLLDGWLAEMLAILSTFFLVSCHLLAVTSVHFAKCHLHFKNFLNQARLAWGRVCLVS